MSNRPDMQQVFDKLLAAPVGTKVLFNAPSETGARTLQSWFRTQVNKYERAMREAKLDNDLFLMVSRTKADKGFLVTIEKTQKPDEPVWLFPEDKENDQA